MAASPAAGAVVGGWTPLVTFKLVDEHRLRAHTFLEHRNLDANEITIVRPHRRHRVRVPSQDPQHFPIREPKHPAKRRHELAFENAGLARSLSQPSDPATNSTAITDSVPQSENRLSTPRQHSRKNGLHECYRVAASAMRKRPRLVSRCCRRRNARAPPRAGRDCQELCVSGVI